MQQPFITPDFLLENETAKRLYHQHAAHQPIIDYHCHLNPQMIATDRVFDNLGQLWLEGDHYKWRLMRSNGIPEAFCTGQEATDYEKFERFAATVPYTLRNPMYHWVHLELKTAFGIDTLLKPETARQIYDHCTAQLQQPGFSARGLMRRYGVELVCTTDDPIDTLQHHLALREEGFEIKVLPTWRPDKAMAVEDPSAFRLYIEKLEAASNHTIHSYATLLEALRLRHDYFAAAGCRLSDHGLGRFYAEPFTQAEVEAIFQKTMSGTRPTEQEEAQFKSAILLEFARMDWEKGWVQQFHYGVLRNNNQRLFERAGADVGCDSIGQFVTAHDLSRFLNHLDAEGKLTKTILYNINPADNDMIATLIGNFQDGSVAGKIQFGSGWWFLDQEKGMTDQLNALSAAGLLSRFVGMLTDSRSFLSYPRHEYFRRILCNLIGKDVERGALPASEIDFIGQVVEDICYRNAKNYFGL